MGVEHDFQRFPELTNSQMQMFYFESPHKQILENFMARIVKVTDGDTVRVFWDERDFDFPVRFLDNAAPELKEKGGTESQSWLETKILGEEVEIQIDKTKRVEKWGRLLGRVFFQGRDIGEESIILGHSIPWSQRKASVIPDFNKELDKQWD